MKYLGGINIIKYLFRCLLEVVYPRSYECVICGYKIDEYVLCHKCLNQSSNINQEYNILDLKGVYSCKYYSQVMRSLVIEYKEKRNFEVGEYFIKLLIDKIKEENIEFDIVTFIPSNKSTVKRRGIDHGKYLARGVSEFFNKEVVEFLAKKKESKEQKKLNAYNRMENLKNAFELLERGMENKKVLIIDDVLTTGYTLSVCKNIIEKHNKVDTILLTVIKSSI